MLRLHDAVAGHLLLLVRRALASWQRPPVALHLASAAPHHESLAIDAAPHTPGSKLAGGLLIAAQLPQKQLAASVAMHSTMPVAGLTRTGTVSPPARLRQNQPGQVLALPAVEQDEAGTESSRLGRKEGLASDDRMLPATDNHKGRVARCYLGHQCCTQLACLP
jgi:hypothetical protein